MRFDCTALLIHCIRWLGACINRFSCAVHLVPWPWKSCMHRPSRPLRKPQMNHLQRKTSATSCRLQMVHLRLPQGPLLKICGDRPSDGPIAISEPHEHARHHSGACWPTSVSAGEVHRGHVPACMSRSPCISAVRHSSYLGCGNYITRISDQQLTQACAA